MTSKSSLSTDKPQPFLLRPTGKAYLWGGQRLNDEYVRNVDLNPLAETWECSTHPDGPSWVASGAFAGRTLKDVLFEHSELLGTHHAEKRDIPILIKFIDAKLDLSVQVHPDDAFARRYENGAMGKNEMWYVLDAPREASIIYGFQRNVDEKTVRRALQQGALESYLNRIPIHPNDVFYVPAGTVHGIGAGALIAEIQENSNLTYRLYDYDRLDKDGKPRELHVDKALKVVSYAGGAVPRQPLRTLRYKPGLASELLVRCRSFEVSRLLVNTERCRSLIRCEADKTSFCVLLCTNGCGTLFTDDEALCFFKGDCIFVPARASAKIHARAQFLHVLC